jgi:hypothetical protein
LHRKYTIATQLYIIRNEKGSGAERKTIGKKNSTPESQNEKKQKVRVKMSLGGRSSRNFHAFFRRVFRKIFGRFFPGCFQANFGVFSGCF